MSTALLHEGADLARAVLARVAASTVAKASSTPDPLTPAGFDGVVLLLVRALRKTVRGPEKAAISAFLDGLDANWGAISAVERTRIIDQAAERWVGVARNAAPQVGQVLLHEGPIIARATKEATREHHELRIDPSLSAIDQRVLDTAAQHTALYVRDRYGARKDVLSAHARRVVSSGVEQGFDRYEIGKMLRAELPGAELGRSDAYYRMIADVFAARARTYASLASFEEAGITAYQASAVLDEATTDLCRFLDGKVFSVGAALERFRRVAESEDPEVVAREQPWGYTAKGDGGQLGLYVGKGDARTLVASVQQTGVGTQDAGSYGQVLSDQQIQDLGLTTSPFHAHCRTQLVPTDLPAPRWGSVPIRQPDAPARPAREEPPSGVPRKVWRSGAVQPYLDLQARGLVDAELTYTREQEMRAGTLDVLREVYRREMANGRTPTQVATEVMSPIRVEVEADGTKTLVDGRHRYSIARETGATHVRVKVRQYGKRGAIKWEEEMILAIEPGSVPDFAALVARGVRDEQVFGEGGINQISTAEVAGQKVFVKPATVRGQDGARTTFDPIDAVGMHEAVRRTAEALGVQDAVEPAALLSTTGQPLKFVTRAAPVGRRVLATASSEAIARLSEENRIYGALIDFLHRNSDRHSNNVLIGEDGGFTLIDHDRCHNHVPNAAYGQAKSVFFPTGHAGYVGAQRAFSDLPPRAQRHLSRIAALEATTLAAEFGITTAEASAMKDRATSIIAGGLDAALVQDKARSVRSREDSRTWIKTVGRE